MNAKPAPRKPIDDLTADDLTAFPIWRFINHEGDEAMGEDEDETWVTPLELDHVPAGAYSLSVAATFTTASGREIDGVIEVSTHAPEAEFGHGALLVDGNYLFLPTPEYRECASEYANIATQLGSSRRELFPLTYRLRVPLGESADLASGVFKG